MTSGEGFDTIFDGGTALGLGAGELLDRFAARRDEAAFAALVARHGPMVLATCRRILPDHADADDAFQATFLVLARKADAIADPDRLAPWLHGVARRVAVRSRALAARRRAIEGAGDVASLAVAPPDDRADLRSTLDEELARLPAKYRDPLVLCYLEGLTHDEAAGQLAWPVGTVRSRLAGGRDRLRSRLARRGFGPSATLPIAWPLAVVSRPLGASTLRLVLSASSRSPVAVLAQGVLRSMFLTKLQIAVGLAAATTLLVAGTAGLVSAQKSDQPTEPRPQATAPAQAPRPDPPRPAPAEPDTYPLTVSGRARDAAGQPISGARVFLGSTKLDDFRRLAEARTDAAGHYQFRDVPLSIKPPSDPAFKLDVGGFVVFGVADGYGFACLPRQRVNFLPASSRREPQAGVPDPFRPGEPIALDLTFPPPARFTGNVRDERGQPLARAAARIVNWGRQVPDQPILIAEFREWSLFPDEVLRRSTDDLGNFVFDGLPLDQQFVIEVTPVGFPGRRVAVATSAEPPPVNRDGPIRVSPVVLTFETPRDVAVRVTAGDTGQPLPKALVQVVRLAGEHAWDNKTTDDDGRVTLRLPPGEYRVELLPAYGTPYLVTESPKLTVPADGLIAPVEATLRAACVLEVTVTDVATGAGVAGAALWEGEPPGPAHPTEDHRQLLFFRSWEVATRIAHVDRPVSDAAGKLRALIEPGPHRVGVGWQGEPLGWTADERDGRAIDAQAGQTIPLTFTMRRRP